MAIRKRFKKTEAKKAKTPVSTPEVKSVDAIIDAQPAHSNNATREYLRALIKGDINAEIRIKRGKK